MYSDAKSIEQMCSMELMCTGFHMYFCAQNMHNLGTDTQYTKRS